MFAVQAASSVPSSVVMIDPIRILDTRTDVGLPGPFVSAVSQKLQVGDLSAPAGATGVFLNVTVASPSADGFVSVRPGDATGPPTTSSLNFTAGTPAWANAVPVALGRLGKIDITYDAYGQPGPTTEILIDLVGYTFPGGVGTGAAGPAGPAGPPGADGTSGITAASNKKDDIVDPPANTFGTAMSVTVQADSVGIIQIVGSALVLAIGTPDAFDCEIKRNTGNNNDLEDTDRRVHVGASQTGFCSTNGTLAVGPGTHQIDLVVRKGQSTSIFDDGTLQAVFIPGGILDNTDG